MNFCKQQSSHERDNGLYVSQKNSDCQHFPHVCGFCLLFLEEGVQGEAAAVDNFWSARSPPRGRSRSIEGDGDPHSASGRIPIRRR